VVLRGQPKQARTVPHAHIVASSNDARPGRKGGGRIALPKNPAWFAKSTFLQLTTNKNTAALNASK
jgi:hypothetical protein